MHSQLSPEQQFSLFYKYEIGKVWQKYCNGLTPSLQNPEKLLFHATFTLLMLWSFSVHVSQPYVNDGCEQTQSDWHNALKLIYCSISKGHTHSNQHTWRRSSWSQRWRNGLQCLPRWTLTSQWTRSVSRPQPARFRCTPQRDTSHPVGRWHQQAPSARSSQPPSKILIR